MKEKLHEYALVAELVSAFAIVVSLVFVGVQINYSNKLSQADTYKSIRDDGNAINLMALDNREFSELLLKMANNEALSPIDEQQLRYFGHYLLHYTDTAFNQYQSGLIEKNDLIRALTPVRAFTRLPRIREHFEIFAPAYGEDFVSFMKQEIMANQ